MRLLLACRRLQDQGVVEVVRKRSGSVSHFVSHFDASGWSRERTDFQMSLVSCQELAWCSLGAELVLSFVGTCCRVGVRLGCLVWQLGNPGVKSARELLLDLVHLLRAVDRIVRSALCAGMLFAPIDGQGRVFHDGRADRELIAVVTDELHQNLLFFHWRVVERLGLVAQGEQ